MCRTSGFCSSVRACFRPLPPPARPRQFSASTAIGSGILACRLSTLSSGMRPSPCACRSPVIYGRHRRRRSSKSRSVLRATFSMCPPRRIRWPCRSTAPAAGRRASPSRWGPDVMVTAEKITSPDAGDRSPAEVSQDVTALGLEWIDALLAKRESVDDAAAKYREARAGLIDRRMPAGIDRVSALFRLAPFDEDLLLLLLHALRHGRPKPVTPQVAQAELGIRGGEALARSWERLAPNAPLRRFRLIDSGERVLTAATTITIDERVARFLIGEDRIDERIAAMLAAVEGGPCPKRHGPGIEKLAARLKRGAHPLVTVV